jgi:hypothetical protein
MNSKEQIVNEVIAEWVGFKERLTPGTQSSWWEYDGYPYAQCPDFMNSETACFSWIVPALQKRGYGVDITIGKCGAFINLFGLEERHGENNDDASPAVALGIDTSVSAALCTAVLSMIKTERAGGPRRF